MSEDSEKAIVKLRQELRLAEEKLIAEHATAGGPHCGYVGASGGALYLHLPRPPPVSCPPGSPGMSPACLQECRDTHRMAMSAAWGAACTREQAAEAEYDACMEAAQVEYTECVGDDIVQSTVTRCSLLRVGDRNTCISRYQAAFVASDATLATDAAAADEAYRQCVLACCAAGP